MSPREIACDSAQLRGELGRLKSQQQRLDEAEHKLSQSMSRRAALEAELVGLQQAIEEEEQHVERLEDREAVLAATAAQLRRDIERATLERNAAQEHLVTTRATVAAKQKQLLPLVETVAQKEEAVRQLLAEFFGDGALSGTLDQEDVEIAVEKQRLDLEAVVAHYNEQSDELHRLTNERLPELEKEFNALKAERDRQRDMNTELHQELQTLQNEVVKSEEEQKGLADWGDDVVDNMMRDHISNLNRLLSSLGVTLDANSDGRLLK